MYISIHTNTQKWRNQRTDHIRLSQNMLVLYVRWSEKPFSVYAFLYTGQLVIPFQKLPTSTLYIV